MVYYTKLRVQKMKIIFVVRAMYLYYTYVSPQSDCEHPTILFLKFVTTCIVNDNFQQKKKKIQKFSLIFKNFNLFVFFVYYTQSNGYTKPDLEITLSSLSAG